MEEENSLPKEEDPQIVANRKSRESLEVGQHIFELTHASGARAEELKAALSTPRLPGGTPRSLPGRAVPPSLPPVLNIFCCCEQP